MIERHLTGWRAWVFFVLVLVPITLSVWSEYHRHRHVDHPGQKLQPAICR